MGAFPCVTPVSNRPPHAGEPAVSPATGLGEEGLRLAFNACPDALAFIRRTDGRLIDVNDAFAQLTGYDRRAALGRTLGDLGLAPDRRSTATLALGLRRSGVATNVGCRIRGPGGRTLQCLLSARLVTLNHLPHIIVSARDAGPVTTPGSVAVDAAEIGMNAVLAQAIEQAPVSIVLTDSTGTIRYVNPAFCRTSGLTAAEAVGQNPRVLKSGYTSPAEYQRLWTTIAAGKIWRGEFHNRTKGGACFWESAVIAPIHDERGYCRHYLAIKDDISQRKTAEIDLLMAKEAAESASRAKSTFLAHVSHELRTPLNAVIGFAEIMNRQLFGPLGDRHYRDYAKHIGDSGLHLLALINDILDLSKIEAGRMDMIEDTVDVAAAVDTTCTLLRGRAEAGEVLLTTNWNNCAPPTLRADTRMVRQILLNIVSNAVKFTPPEGRVIISNRRDRDGGLVIEVADTGQGMDSGALAVALTPFGQNCNPFLNKDQGSGLGLPLAKSLTELHGGTLTLSSAPNHGTTVTIRFPPERIIGGNAFAEPEL